MIALWVWLAAVLVGLPFLRTAARRAREEQAAPLPHVAFALAFGVWGAYALMIRRDARVRGMAAPALRGGLALVAAAAGEILLLAGTGPWRALGAGAAVWLVAHLLHAMRRPPLTVDRVLARRREPGGTEGPWLLEVEDLTRYFPIRRGILNRTVGHVRAVDGVSFAIRPGETLGLVGESGCGKTTLGRTLLRLIEPSGGTIRYRGVDLAALTPAELRAMRKEVQIIFQDPWSSLNPRLTVDSMLREALALHGIARGRAADARVAELLEMVGLAAYHARRYPHEFSGGQRQRLGIARALAVEPRLIVCDEPVSALDVSVQAQIVNLLKDLQRRLGLAYLFIAHDLNVVEHISDRVAVMYLGRIVELADRDALYADPRHPYTRALLSAVPVPDPRLRRRRIVLSGDVPSPARPPSGCPFHPRCPEARPECATRLQAPVEAAPGHLVACHRAPDLAPWEAGVAGG